MLRKALLPIAAFISYALLALYLYYPHFEHFGRLDYLYPVNSVLAGLGCFVLSRRWISSFAASLLAGGVSAGFRQVPRYRRLSRRFRPLVSLPGCLSGQEQMASCRHTTLTAALSCHSRFLRSQHPLPPLRNPYPG